MLIHSGDAKDGKVADAYKRFVEFKKPRNNSAASLARAVRPCHRCIPRWHWRRDRSEAARGRNRRAARLARLLGTARLLRTGIVLFAVTLAAGHGQQTAEERGPADASFAWHSSPPCREGTTDATSGRSLGGAAIALHGAGVKAGGGRTAQRECQLRTQLFREERLAAIQSKISVPLVSPFAARPKKQNRSSAG